MQPAEWISFIAQFGQLNRRQRQAGMALLRGNAPHDATVALLESAVQPRLACPACHSAHLHRHGHAHGLQRYRCVPCGRTFNALTGTPLAHLRHKALWFDYADCLLASDSVRKAARQLGVHRNTTFRWRHRFLSLAKTDRPHGLHGIAEADELYLLESEKGARQMTRPARRRGGHARQRGISNEQVCILVARDRTGQTLDFVTGKGALTKAQLHHCLLPMIDKDVLHRWPCRLSGFCPGSGYQPPGRQL
ncbi:Transposase, partial [Janthinobacterium lividum]